VLCVYLVYRGACQSKHPLSSDIISLILTILHISTMVVPSLKIDILRRVIECALEGCTVPHDQYETQLNRQQSLANLILVSKVSRGSTTGARNRTHHQTFKSICTPQLYKDCLVSDMNRFLAGPNIRPRSEKLANPVQVKTLRIYHSESRRGPSYTDLFTGSAEWIDVGCSKGTDRSVTSEKIDIISFDYLKNDQAADKIRQVVKAYPRTFSSLDRVCLTPTGDQSWGSDPAHARIDESFSFVMLPFVLSGLPSVKHYCQGTQLGPLALGCITIKPTHPPKVSTYHCPHTYGFWDPDTLPPIILGSINRYMSPHCIQVLSPVISTFMTDGIYTVVKPLLTLLSAQVVVVQKGDGQEQRPIGSVSKAGTIIEVYNIIDYEPGFDATSRFTPAERLAMIQHILDLHLGPWRGIVVLKLKEDCPPCSACGFKLE